MGLHVTTFNDVSHDGSTPPYMMIVQRLAGTREGWNKSVILVLFPEQRVSTRWFLRKLVRTVSRDVAETTVKKADIVVEPNISSSLWSRGTCGASELETHERLRVQRANGSCASFNPGEDPP